MSIETDLSRIADALEFLAKNLSVKTPTVVAPPATVQPNPVPQVTTPPAALTAVAAPFPTQPAAAPIVAPAPAASGTPAAMILPAAPAPVAAPVTDPFGGKGLMGYAMEAYQAMGAAKGAGIQTILTQFGHQNINDLRPDQYVAFHAEVEKLKVTA